MKIILLIFFMLSCGIYAQSDTLNQKDSLGKRQGYWIIYGKDEPQKGYPEEGKITEGSFLNDRKHGDWIMYYKDGFTPKAKGYFENHRPVGPFEMYYIDGGLRRKGTYSNMRCTGEFSAYWMNGNLSKELTFNKDGKSHGGQVYYFENGHKKVEMFYNDGKPIDTTIYYYPNGNLRSIIIRDSLGIEIASFMNPEIILDSSGIEIYRSTEQTLEKSNLDDTSKPFDTLDIIDCLTRRNQYGSAGELLFDGEFKNGCLWNGRVYLYDRDGLLKKVKILKQGKYSSFVEDINDSHKVNKKESMDLKELRESCACPDTSQSKIDTRIHTWSPRGSKHQDRYDGIVCDDKFWCGWLCVYDRDGLLLKVKVYSNGKYIGDAQL